MTLRAHMMFWAAMAVLFLGFVWALGDMLVPFVVGLAIAYLLDPVMRRLSRTGMPRAAAALIILLSFFAVVVTVLALIIPFAYREAVQLAQALPGYAEQARTALQPYFETLQTRFGAGDMSSYQDMVQKWLGRMFSVSGNLVGGIMSGGQALVGVIALCALTPLVAFFMMVQWEPITRWIDGMIPRGSYIVIKDMLHDMNTKLGGFIRGQLTVSFILGMVYALALTIAGLNYGFLIGVVTGILSVIPYVGSTFGLVASLGIAWFQTGGDWSYIGIIAAIFLVGQFIEGNFITPRIMGQAVGLHPLWILFALLAGGTLLGLVGMLLAVPVAVIISVLVRFAVRQYKASLYYTDGETVPPPVTAEQPAEEPQGDQPQ
ncbi:AI-2E family transporter [Micavibrio aeruginosavorus]|uniref:AI-2E family transporter n=1 Tax=Micavibrio aeruginosavorus TaxID=349221 RepID=UPI003F4ABC8D